MGHIEDLHKRKDGSHKPAYGKGLRWRVIYDDGGRRRSKSFRTQDAARAFLTSVDHKQRAGEYVPREAQRALIGDLLPQWEASLIRLKPSTRKHLRSYINATLAPKWGGCQVGAVTRRDVQAWVAEMHHAGMAARTVDTKYGKLRAFYNWAVREGYAPTSPCTDIMLPRGGGREHIYLPPEEVRALLDRMDEHYRPLVMFLVTTGARFGEACELRVKDLDLTRRRAAIARSYWRGEVTLPKTHKRRSLPLTGPMAETLAGLISGRSRDSLVFTTKRGHRVTIANFTTLYYEPAREAAGLPDELTVRDLRHTAASLAVSSGANVKAVQRMLGHASAAQSLDVYSGLFSSDLDSVAEGMSKLLDAED